FVESAKAVLAGTSAAHRQVRRLLFVGTNGCWNFRGRIGKTEAADGTRVDEMGINPDLDLIDLAGDRDAVILFDGNATTNPSVGAARREFARELKRRGARVQFADLPIEAGIN